MLSAGFIITRLEKVENFSMKIRKKSSEIRRQQKEKEIS